MSTPTTAPAPAVPLTPAGVVALQARRAYPSVSLLLTTAPGARPALADRATLERLAREARRRLLADPAVDAATASRVLEELDRQVAGFAGPVARASALFVSPDHSARVDLPVTVEDRCVVDPTFATRDLVRALHRTPRHVVLLLAADEARLMDGGGGRLSAVRHGFPRHDLHHRRGTPARERFLREVDQSLGAYLRLHPAPLVVVAAQPTLSSFVTLSRHTGRLAGTVVGHHLDAPLEELRSRIAPVIESYLHSRQGEALDLLHQRDRQGRAVHGLQGAWLAARWERPEMLAVEQGYRQAARLSPDGDMLTPAPDVDAPDVIDDVVDELIETVLSRGGWVALLDDGALGAHGDGGSDPAGTARVALTVHR